MIVLLVRLVVFLVDLFTVAFVVAASVSFLWGLGRFLIAAPQAIRHDLAAKRARMAEAEPRVRHVMNEVPPPMALPSADGGLPALEPSDEEEGWPMVCTTAGCDRPTVFRAERCRVHVVDVVEARGHRILFQDPELAGLAAGVIHILDACFLFQAERWSDPFGPTTGLDLYAAVDPEADWPVARSALEYLGAHLSDLFGTTVVEPPVAFPPDVLLRVRAYVPTRNVTRIHAALEIALDQIVHEFVGQEARVRTVVTAVGDDDDLSDS